MIDLNNIKGNVQMMVKNKCCMTEICHEIADYLMKHYTFKTIYGKKQNEIYLYEDGVFIAKGIELISKESERILDSFSKTNIVNEIRNKIERRTFIDRNELDCKDINLVCVENGVLNISTNQLLPHSPKYMFINKLLIKFNASAGCSKFMEFLGEVCYEDDIDSIQEWFGYCLLRSYPVKKAGIVYGPKNTGKTQLLNILQKFVGDKNCSGVSIQKLAEGKWHVKDLYGKYANVCDELSERDVQDVNTFKGVTGGSSVEGEYKFGDSFKFINYAKLIFGANKIPYVNADTDDMAYFDRWMPWKFENVFSPGEKKTKLNVFENIVYDSNEMSGILNWALEGLHRLLENKKFSYHKSAEEVREIMQSESSSVASFVNECLGKDNGKWISKQELYAKYEEYCNLNNKGLELIEKFGRDVVQYCGYVVDGRKDMKTGWYNIYIKDMPIMGFK